MRIFCIYAKSFTRPHSQNHPAWLKASLKNHWSKEIGKKSKETGKKDKDL
jgi:hypothetical protein